MASRTAPEPIADSDTDDDNDGEFFYNEAQDAESSDDDDDTKPATRRHSTQASRHPSKPSSKRSSTTSAQPHPTQPTTAQPAQTLPPIPVVRPTCCICTSVALVDPWLSACGHLCCGECWVAWLMEQGGGGGGGGGEGGMGGACPECGLAIDLEGLKRVVLCDRCARLCVSGAGLHWTHAACHHTCCMECWQGQLASKHTVSREFHYRVMLTATFRISAHCSLPYVTSALFPVPCLRYRCGRRAIFCRVIHQTSCMESAQQT